MSKDGPRLHLVSSDGLGVNFAPAPTAITKALDK